MGYFGDVVGGKWRNKEKISIDGEIFGWDYCQMARNREKIPFKLSVILPLLFDMLNLKKKVEKKVYKTLIIACSMLKKILYHPLVF